MSGFLVLVTAAFGADWAVGRTQPYASLSEVLGQVGPGDRILLDPGTYEGFVLLRNLDRVEIVGPEQGVARFLPGDDGTPTVFSVDGSTDLVLSDLVIDGDESARAMELQGGSTVTLRDVVVRDGVSSDGAGGCLWGEAGTTLTTERTDIEGCAALLEGGALYIRGAFIARETRFEDNTSFRGGALWCDVQASCTVHDSVFDENTATVGGAIYASNPLSLELLRTGFCDHVASGPANDGEGGAVVVDGGEATVRNSLFSDNRTDTLGGAIRIQGGSVELSNNTFVGNEAGESGGAVYQSELFSSARYVNNVLLDNESGADGRALDGGLGLAVGGYNLYWRNDPSDDARGGFSDTIVGDPDLDRGGCNPSRWLPDPEGQAFDAGDPEIDDPDGSRSDVGSTGGPLARRDRDEDEVYDDVDCDDQNPDVFPAAQELCNEIDDDCDGLIDRDDPDVQLSTWFVDADGDGYGDPESVRNDCLPEPGWVNAAGDCNDDAPDVAPGLPELCNGIDDDCDGDVDRDCETGPAVAGFRGGGCGCGAPGPLSWGALLVAIAAVGLRRRH